MNETRPDDFDSIVSVEWLARAPWPTGHRDCGLPI